MFLFIFEEMPLFVKIGVSSLNFSQSAHTLALEKFYEAISHTVWCKGSTNSKMAAYKPLRTIKEWTYLLKPNIYPALYTTKLQNSNGNSHIFKVDKFIEAIPILCKARVRHPRWRLTKRKLICQLVYNVAAQFQRLKTCILRLKNSAERFTLFCNASEWTYISACIQHSCAIPTAIPMFSRSRNSKKLFFIMCDASGR